MITSPDQLKRISPGFLIQIVPAQLPIIPHSARLKWLVDENDSFLDDPHPA